MKTYLTYEKLSIFFNNLKNLFAEKTDLNSHKEDTSIHITSTERINWDSAKTHADSAHAPVDAQANVIESVEVNGVALTPTSKTIDITVPTKVSELTNDSGYKTTDNNTTYSLSKSGSTITLTGSDGSTASVTDSDTVYTHPTYTSKSAGLYKITVDGTGHVSIATAVAKDDITGLGIPAQDTTYSTGTTSTAGITKLYTSTGTSTDGTMTRNAITTELNNLQTEIDSKPSVKIVRWS